MIIVIVIIIIIIIIIIIPCIEVYKSYNKFKH